MFTFVINTWPAYCESHESFTPTTNNVELLRLDNLMWKIITADTFPKHYQIYSIKNVKSSISDSSKPDREIQIPQQH